MVSTSRHTRLNVKSVINPFKGEHHLQVLLNPARAHRTRNVIVSVHYKYIPFGHGAKSRTKHHLLNTGNEQQKEALMC